MADVEPVVEPERQVRSDEGMDLDLVHEDRDLRQVIAMLAKDQRDQARETHEGVISLVASLGHDGRRFRREAAQLLKSDRI